LIIDEELLSLLPPPTNNIVHHPSSHLSLFLNNSSPYSQILILDSSSLIQFFCSIINNVRNRERVSGVMLCFY
jgi:hypothetical protein